jgi:hypothetical protein
MHQKQASSLIGIQLIGQTAAARIRRQSVAFILDLPDHPVGRENAPDSKTLAGISVIAVAHGIDKRFLEAELKSTGRLTAVDGLKQQLHQRTELNGGGKDEISPAERRQKSAEHQTRFILF